ncbi:MAG: chromosome partitioning protein ParB [Crocinitomicaceae bacterium]|nr:chromosome partitioning protein ParB [Crocinitomicaceae bacterium]|tara:strand:+ start:613 stop:1485 length:873 start_codon:yes stop_codon:yes gene_type:complete
MSTKKSALGKGLSALLENSDTDITSKTNSPASNQLLSSISRIPLIQIETNPFQPRTNFNKDALLELSQSIKEHGIIQPITVRKLGNSKFQIISGERRFKASEIAGLTEIPAYIRLADDQSMLEMAIIENVQRSDLNAIEIGISYKRLLDECELTQNELSTRIGKNRSTISNFIRILNLPEKIQAGIRDNLISMGHARALLSFETEKEMINAYDRIVANQLSVRKTENLSKKSNTTTPTVLSRYEKRMQAELKMNFNTNVKINKTSKGNGKILITFKDDTDLNRILELLDN